MFMVHSNYCPLFRGENPLHLLVAIQLVDVFILQSATSDYMVSRTETKFGEKAFLLPVRKFGNT